MHSHTYQNIYTFTLQLVIKQHFWKTMVNFVCLGNRE